MCSTVRARSRRSSQWRRGLAVAIVVAIALSGCSDQDGNASLHFTNGTTSTLTVAVRYPDQGNEFVLQSKIEPGMTSVTRSDVFPGNTCSDRGVLIARTPPERR